MLRLEMFDVKHAEAILQMSGRELYVPRQAALAAWARDGARARTLMSDEGPVACGGIITLGWGVGEAWVLESPLASRYGKTVIATLKKMFPVAAEGLRRVQATSFNLSQCRLFELLGFQREGVLRSCGPHGEDAAMWSRIFGGSNDRH